MTPLQVATLWQCTYPNGIDQSTDQPGLSRQTNWLLKRRLIRKLNGRFVATRQGKRAALYQTEDWLTIPNNERQRVVDSLKRRRPTNANLSSA
jgi:hypothetical protein